MARKIKVKKIITDAPRGTGQAGGKRSKPWISTVSDRCRRCRFYAEGTRCRAFPDGIPHAILAGRHDHTKPYSGDRGFRFDPLTSGA